MRCSISGETVLDPFWHGFAVRFCHRRLDRANPGSQARGVDPRPQIKELRKGVRELGAMLRSLSRSEMMDVSQLMKDPKAAPDIGEVKANLTLAFRHLEDARMRMGKAIQAYEGGESIYGD